MNRWLLTILGVATIFAAPVAVEQMAEHWWAVLACTVILVGMFTATIERTFTHDRRR